MKMKKSVLILAAAALVLLSGCTKNIKLGNQRFSEESTELRAVISAEDTAKLDRFPALKAVNLSGSTCYEEISRWAEAHPDTDVRFSLTFPDGTVAENGVEMLTLSGLTSADLPEVSRLLQYMTGLKYVSLEGGSLTPGDVKALSEAFPALDISCGFDFLGQTVDYHCDSLSLKGLTSQDVQSAADLISALPELRIIELGSDTTTPLSWEEIKVLEDACPKAEFKYRFHLYGKEFSLGAMRLDVSHIPITDDGALVRRVIACMPRISILDMDSCGVSNEAMAAIRDDFPQVDVIWRIWFGEAYSVRTDVKRILASNPTSGGNLTPKNTGDLKYCTKVRYMDIGHNEILGDISFVQYMPELEVLIVAMDGLSDISPLSACTKLEYLEIQTNPQLTDISPLASLTELKHLNMARNGGVSDLSPLFGMKKLERLWLGASSSYSPEQIAKIQANNPDCNINIYVYLDPTEGGWRYTGSDPKVLWTVKLILHKRYEELLAQFDNYDRSAYSFYWNDPKCY